MGAIGSWGSGATPSKGHPEFYGGSIPWLTTGELNESYVFDTKVKVTEKALACCSLRKCATGDVLIAMYGATIGKVAIAGCELTTNQACCACTPYYNYNKYLFYFLMSNKLNFIKMGEGGAQPNISKEKIVATLCPLPPLNEQRRIVYVVESLIPKIEHFTTLQANLEELNASIFTKLRKSILQEAIQGRLVPQDPADEPASGLLARIREEKLRLFKEGKLKKKDITDSVIFKDEDNKYYEKIGNETVCIDEEIPFDIPQSWSWTRLQSICKITNGFTPLRSEEKFWKGGSINWFTVDDIHEQGEYITETKQRITQEATSEERIVRAGSVLLCCTASIGQCAITRIATTTNQQFNALTIKDEYRDLIDDEYLFIFAKTLKDELNRLAGTTTFAFVSVKKVGNILIPIPPIIEQKRVVDIVKKSISSTTRKSEMRLSALTGRFLS